MHGQQRDGRLDDGLDVLLRNIRNLYGWRQTRDSVKLLMIQTQMDGWEFVPRHIAESGRLYEKQMSEVFVVD